MRERDLELVDAVVPGFVDARRLAGRADEEAGEEVPIPTFPVPTILKLFPPFINEVACDNVPPRVTVFPVRVNPFVNETPDS